MAKDKDRSEKIKAQHGKHAPNVESVLDTMDAAGDDPRARIAAGLRQMYDNAQSLKNPHDLREAIDHAAGSLDEIVAYAFKDATVYP